jgi:teichoic acid transport system ATP-binding protein
VAEAIAADPGTDDDGPARPDRALGDLTVLARDLHITYRVYEDRRTSLREVVANRLRRPSYREVHAVRGVDLEAREGEAIGLIGRNGSGKSTLMKGIAGLLPPSQGEVYASSQPSLLGVSAALQKNVSGRRNIVLGLLALGLTRDEVEERMPAIIEFTGLEDFIELPIRAYSSGMRARLQFALATAVEPEILLIDEALNVGDEIFKRRGKERIDDLLDRAGTVFVVSHSMSTVRDLCDRVVWLDDGRIEEDGDPRTVIKAYRRRFRQQR